mmetsp:Transcript_57268/g.150719  ORF Transcript_57268/g.150719 Transcript_57268/m.150719 type:complete len:727 (-) Transcript_57268:56-2236(-)
MAGQGEDPHEESIKVCCRFRPQNQIERDHNGKICVEVPTDHNNEATSVHVSNTDHTFVFDRVFRWDADQKEVYDYAAKPIINAVLRGFNGTVFAYGQTSSGKTYTMEGPDIEDKVYQGVIPRMVWSIFDGIYHADEHIEFLVKVSIVEIYNERIRDLLDPKKDNLKVHEDKVRGVFIGEVTESYVGCEQEIFDAMRAGHYNRSMAVTNMNEHSSRSHLVFMLTIEQKNLHDRSVKVGKLHLVDLAGSEKVAKTGASGERLDEAKNINRSLSALGNVINALTDKKYTHVPYRDSKLTRVLQESLGGNAKTSLIITCSPSNFNEQETISTLRFGQRAKMIKNVVKVNLERSAEELKLLLDKRDHQLEAVRRSAALMEGLLRQHGIGIPEGSRSDALAAPPPPPADDHEGVDQHDQLQDMREQLAELGRERDELQSLLRSCDEEKQALHSQVMDFKLDREKIEYERHEWASEVERLRHGKDAARAECEELQRSYQSLLRAAGAEGGQQEASASAEPGSAGALRPGSAPGAAELVLDRLRDADRPLKRKVSQLDKNLEQLTVMYHKLVAQNSGLKVEVSENDKKIQRKDQRITQLEKNLREAKQKYEKLLTQCANLTSAMDCMGKGRAADTASSSATGAAVGDPERLQVRRANIVRPVRGGVASGYPSADLAGLLGAVPARPPDFGGLDSPASVHKRETSRTRLSNGGLRGDAVPYPALHSGDAVPYPGR